MTYACENCGFLFSRVGAVERCPVCGLPRLRAANEAEQSQLEEQLKQEGMAATPKGALDG